jgi:hypothetical protein
MPYWQNDIFRLEVEEVVGNENSLDLGSSVSVTRRFQVRQVEREGVEFEPIPYALANLCFYDFVQRFEPFYVDLPFKQIRFVEDKEKIGEIFDAEVVYSLEFIKSTDEQQEFTLPTFSMTGGKKKQLLPANVPNAVIRYVKDNEKAVEYKMLGWDGKQFNGIEIESGDLKFMVPAWYPASAMKFLFMERLNQFIGTVNSVPFYGLQPGECKYLGPEQSWVTRSVETGNSASPRELIRVIELQHHFQPQRSQKDVAIGDIVIPEIPGWAYVDVHYEDSLVDIGDGKKVPLAVPKQVDVVKVYEEMDFWALFDGRILEGLWGGPPL